jgi:hypothetical protein
VFLKRCRRRKSGKDRVYWQLVGSYRTPRGSRHRVVAYLGELSKDKRRGRARLATTLDGKAASKARRLFLFEPPSDDDNGPVRETVRVKTRGVRVERTRDFGDVYLALCLWRMPGLDDFFKRELPAGREDVPWPLAACILAVARLVEPSSELHVEDTWYLGTALAELVGFPLGYEVFAGNRADVTTLEEIVEAMEAEYGRADRIWVFDRGIVSEGNLEFLRERGGQYLVGTPKKQLRKFEKELIDKDWREVRSGIEVRLVPSPEGEETFVLCRSRDRREKERAMHERFVARIGKGLEAIQKELRRAKRPRDRGKIERRIGALLGKNSRAAKAFEVELIEDPDRPAGLRLRYRSVTKWRDWAAVSEGCYLLRTNLSGKTPEELWKTYIQLTDVEEVFRTEKTELAIRPIFHQLERRVQAHVLFSFLAYAMWKTLQTWMERSGLGRGARTVIEEFARVKAADVVLPTTGGRDVRLTCVTRPDKAQAAVIERLGLDLPERLGRPLWVPVPAEADPACSLDFPPRTPQIGRQGQYRP